MKKKIVNSTDGEQRKTTNKNNKFFGQKSQLKIYNEYVKVWPNVSRLSGLTT